MQDETKEKIASKQRGKKLSEKTKQKIAFAKTGSELTAEHRKNLSRAQRKRRAKEWEDYLQSKPNQILINTPGFSARSAIVTKVR